MISILVCNAVRCLLEVILTSHFDILNLADPVASGCEPEQAFNELMKKMEGEQMGLNHHFKAFVCRLKTYFLILRTRTVYR